MIEWLFLLAVFPLSLLLEGLNRKLNARMQGRIGPPILQPFWDLVKLWTKSPSDSSSRDDPFFRLTPFLYLATTFCLFLFVPFSLVAFRLDFILLAYITILGSSFYVLGGLSSSSPFGIIGSMREMVLMVLYEITFVISLFTFMLFGGADSFASYSVQWGFASLPLATICLVAVAVTEIKITPFDTAEAPTEVYEGFMTEFSSRNLALLEAMKHMKSMFFAMMISFLAVGSPYGPAFWISTVFFISFFTYERASTPRYRVDQAFRIFILILILSLIELGRVMIWA